MTTTTFYAGRRTVDVTERLGRVALATQGTLYLVVGLLAASLALGDHGGGTEASQRGAIASVARQPFGRLLLIALLAGQLAHAAWRILLAARGEPGPDDDGKSLVKRAANGGRALVYLGLALVAFRFLTHSGGGRDDSERESTARVLEWPGGRWLVVAAGLAVIGVGLWRMTQIVTADFLDDLDLSGVRHRMRRVVELSGRVGYLARGVAFGLVGWFLLVAGIQHDPSESRGLDESLRELLGRPNGPWLLGLLAVGMVLFGAHRILDARYRTPSELVHA